MNFGDARLPQRFWDKCVPVPFAGCWLWTASSINGYGVLGGGTATRGTNWQARAHRWAYEQLFGAVPKRLDLDHLCRVRCCVNPAHLEPVTRAENLRRSPLTAHARKSATHCKRGHEFTLENTGGGARQRLCRACARAYQQTYGKAA